MAGVLGNHWASQFKGAGINSTGQMNPARNTNGRDESNTIWLGRSRLRSKAPNSTPNMVVASTKGSTNSQSVVGEALRVIW